jgi:hypothetical protein
LGRLRHTACLTLSQSGGLLPQQLNLLLDRPARPISVRLEFVATVPGTVQFRFLGPIKDVIMTTPIIVVGTVPQRRTYQLPQTPMDNWSATSDVVRVAIGSNNQTISLFLTVDMLVAYSNELRSLC